MSKIAALVAMLAAQITFQMAPVSAQEAMEKKSYNYSAWTPGIFSEAVTITSMGKGKFIRINRGACVSSDPVEPEKSLPFARFGKLPGTSPA